MTRNSEVRSVQHVKCPVCGYSNAKVLLPPAPTTEVRALIEELAAAQNDIARAASMPVRETKTHHAMVDAANLRKAKAVIALCELVKA